MALAVQRPADACRVSFPSDVAGLRTSRWLFFVVGTPILCQLALLVPPLQRARIAIRILAYLSALPLLFLVRRVRTPHPSWPVAVASLAIILFSVLHPDTSSPLAGLATALLHVAVMAPLFCVPQIAVDSRAVRNVFVAVFVLHGASAILGTLQAFLPGTCDFALAVDGADESHIDALRINLANGARIFRPQGLTDAPGGAALSGVYAVVFGVAMLSERPRLKIAVPVVGCMLCALFSLYICQVRLYVVMMAVCLIALAIPLAIQMRLRAYATLGVILAGVALVGFTAAVAIAGDQESSNRILTLIERDPMEVYAANRGVFFQHTMRDLVPLFPLGAGLGRYGMLNHYFADRLSGEPLWAEIQWTGWLYNGGVPLMLTSLVSILIAIGCALRIARDPGPLQRWATVLFAFDVGVLAVTFGSSPFDGAMGFDFWCFNAILYAASLAGRAPRNTYG